ncbi:phosphonate ABC transporter ATP-binding protein [Aquibacillus koreensis]|uniref:Phosphonate ABC transporter ATP-binding protein n=1 Tax=Aquibacillus koreensis TaxID=279446 RepID=A0A9X3WKD2_9BACI|nr:phosphonate ABC transporter ATP-binding protein [Aquibacillus koreensis]MCT2536007.1 phosphonate ABC transporter ATP-binding protein [Aquibacillus koreensis]MDC3420463.1 phosphonate ABC transporter ATP-binding protein [Aquibacillus koreensis]
MLEIKDLSVRFQGNKDDALSHINLSFEKGEFVCILGKSGAGKSTFIRCLNGLQKPTTGEVYWNNHSLFDMNEEQLRKIRREMGMIFQHFNLVPRLTVMQNVLTGTFGYRSTFKNLLGLFSAEEINRAKETIEDVGLTDQINRKVELLSGGQKQRVGIARALLQQPKVFLGDEPVSSLDPGTSNHIFNLIQDIHNQHQLLTIINVHDVHLAKRYATRLIALKDGKMIFDGRPEEFDEEKFHVTYHAASNQLDELPVH